MELTVFELSQMLEEPANLDEISEAVHEINKKGGTGEFESVSAFNERRYQIVGVLKDAISFHRDYIRECESTIDRLNSLEINIKDEE